LQAAAGHAHQPNVYTTPQEIDVFIAARREGDPRRAAGGVRGQRRLPQLDPVLWLIIIDIDYWGV
jgi:hypothetical protein